MSIYIYSANQTACGQLYYFHLCFIVHKVQTAQILYVLQRAATSQRKQPVDFT